ncbi:MAG: sulfatase-like hydrolase/transferase [Cyclobacteriaceae bacterium]
MKYKVVFLFIFLIDLKPIGFCADGPNITFIMADDLGYGDLSCYRARKILTPNIDRIAGEGTMFTDAHSPAAVCNPTHYAVLTGIYGWRSRLKKEVLWDGYRRCLIEPNRTTIGNMMKSKGYHTAQIGKWHLGWEDEEPVDYTKGYLGRGPKDLGFDYSFVTAVAHNLFPITFVENHQVLAKEFKPIDYHIYEHGKKEIPRKCLEWHQTTDIGPSLIYFDWQPYLVDSIYTVKAFNFITEHLKNNQDQLFYLHLTPDAHHTPNNVPGFLKGSSQAGDRGDHTQMFDWMVGQINEALHRLNIDKKTLLIITSDNGVTHAGVDEFGHKGWGKLKGRKGTRLEGCHRVPLIIKWDGFVQSSVKNNGLICLVDMMATFSHIIGYELGDNIGEDSFDVFTIITGKKKEIRESLVMNNYQGRFAIRKGKWKLVDEELYILGTDLVEENNVADKYPGIVKELKDLLRIQQAAGFTAKRSSLNL